MNDHPSGIRYVLFDLDDTVYARDKGLMDLISRRISEYMEQRLGMDPKTVKELRQRYYERYGTTGRGLFIHHSLDLEDYFSFVHDVPVEELLRRDGDLDQMLEGLDAEKVIFTNATTRHARRVLRALGIERHFARIIDIHDLEFIPKPDIRAYKKVLKLLKARPEECMLVEDRVRNLTPGKALGMSTVLVGGTEPAEGADFVLEDITELGKLLEHPRAPEGQ
jgi:putative hydrolase of the HAD superfamily